MKTLLLIEDDSIMGESLVQRFELEGFNVSWCRRLSEAGEALSSQGTEGFGAVISDVRLTDGLATRWFMDLPDTQRALPWFFLTGYGSVNDAVATVRAGAREYLTKPFDIERLVSGLSGSSSYACKAPDGVTCDSVSGTYANAIHNNLPSQRSRTAAPPRPADEPRVPDPRRATSPPLPGALATASASPMPLRSSARILRLWFKPWEDADRDLYDQGYVYVQIDNGQWLVEHAQRQIRDAYAPLRPPPRTTAPEAREDTTPATDSRSAPRLPSAENPLPGLLQPTRPDTSD